MREICQSGSGGGAVLSRLYLIHRNWLSMTSPVRREIYLIRRAFGIKPETEAAMKEALRLCFNGKSFRLRDAKMCISR